MVFQQRQMKSMVIGFYRLDTCRSLKPSAHPDMSLCSTQQRRRLGRAVTAALVPTHIPTFRSVFPHPSPNTAVLPATCRSQPWGVSCQKWRQCVKYQDSAEGC